MPLRWLLAAAAFLACVAASATPIFTTTYALTDANATELGRLSRSGVASDWSASKAFPGVLNAATSYHYQTFTLDLDTLMAGYTFGQYLQINVDFGADTRDFVSAYLDSYDPTNKSTNYLGDVGASGNLFGNPAYFQVIVGSGHDLVLVLTDTVSGSIVTPASVSLQVEAFMDTEYTDLSPSIVGELPEPAALALVAIALVAMVHARRRKAR